MSSSHEYIGAFIGSFSAVIFSAVGYLLVRWIEGRRERAETLRRIEVGLTYTLNTTHNTKEKLTGFIKRIRLLIEEIQKISDPKAFSLNAINIPALASIYLDTETPQFRIGSYYLHNKLLWIHSGTTDLNVTISSLKDDYERIIKLNDRMMDLMLNNNIQNPPEQRRAYAENLNLFTDELENFCNKQFPLSIKTLIQAKIYNEKLRASFFQRTINHWRHEGISFKYFRTEKILNEYHRNLVSIDRIDSEIEDEVQILLKNMNLRAEQLRNQ